MEPASDVLAKPGISQRASHVSPFVVMEVMRAAALKEAAQREAGALPKDRVLHLEVGQPATGAPKGAVEAAMAALQSGAPLGYTSALGDIALRDRISQHYEESYGVQLDRAQIAITTGSSAAFTALFAACFDVGDRVVVPVPGYPCYRHILAALGITAVPVRSVAADGYALHVEAISAAATRVGGVQGVVIASPNNPTGAVLSHCALRKIAEFCRADGIRLISDEIYHGVSNTPTPSALETGAVVINSFSKYYSMTGYRVGWLACRDDTLMSAVERLLQNLNICAPALSQRAALGAFGCERELDGHVRRYWANLEVLNAALPALGFEELYKPKGAFYVYAGCRSLLQRSGIGSSLLLCERVLEDAAVALTPGVDFDPEMGHHYVRLSYSGSTADIELACERLKVWVADHCRS